VYPVKHFTPQVLSVMDRVWPVKHAPALEVLSPTIPELSNFGSALQNNSWHSYACAGTVVMLQFTSMSLTDAPLPSTASYPAVHFTLQVGLVTTDNTI
jgi:hypothetical protein